MTQTHWRKHHNPDYIGAYALDPGKDLVVTIKEVKVEKVKSERGTEECSVAHFVENVKPMILNTTNSKVIAKIHKTPYIEEWGGKKIQLYVENVKAFGEVVEALRIRNYPPKETVKAQKCEDCKKEISAYGNMKSDQVAAYTKAKYSKCLCTDCGKKYSYKVEDADANK